MGERVFTWYFDSIDNHIFHVQQPAQHSLHLGCGHVLSFPAVSVSSAVLEVHVSILIHDQHIAWTHVVEYFSLVHTDDTQLMQHA